MKLLMISGKGAAELARGKHGAFFATLEEFRKHWDRIDIIAPRVSDVTGTHQVFENVFVHVSTWSMWRQPKWIVEKGVELIKEFRHDVMTVNEYAPFYNGIGAAKLNKKTGIKYLLEIFHITGHPHSNGLKEFFYRTLARFFIATDARRAHAVRVMNKKQVPDFLIQAGVPREKITLIPAVYIDLDVFRPINLQKKFDVIFIGRLAKNKGTDLFLEALSKTDASALIVGEGPEKNHIMDFIRQNRLESKVKLHGWAKDAIEINELLNQSKMLVMTSHSEGGPRVVFEAMAAGTPVIATPVGVVIDEIRDYENGRIVNWNADEISKAITEILNKPELAKRLSEEGTKTVQKFERKAAIRNYADWLKKMN